MTRDVTAGHPDSVISNGGMPRPSIVKDRRLPTIPGWESGQKKSLCNHSHPQRVYQCQKQRHVTYPNVDRSFYLNTVQIKVVVSSNT